MSFNFEKVENIVGKGKKCCLPAFVLFSQCFLQTVSSYSLKIRIAWQRVKHKVNEQNFASLPSISQKKNLNTGCFIDVLSFPIVFQLYIALYSY